MRHLAAALALLSALAFPSISAAEGTRSSFALGDRFADGDVDAFDALRVATPAASDGAPRYGGFSLTLGAHLGQSDRLSDRGGFVVVALPLDAIFDPRPRSVRPPPRPVLALGDEDIVRTAANANVVVDPSQEARHEIAPPTPAYARAIVAAAYRANGVGEGLARLDDLASRARKSALLPELRLRATRYVDDRASIDALPDQSRLTDSSSQNLGLEARVTFRLDRLAFADEEPGLERARLDVQSYRAKLAQKVLELLFKHHRARVIAREQGPDREEARVQAAELEAALDAMTGGYFSQHVP